MKPLVERRQSKRTIPLPREHGGWAMLLVPLIIGWGIGSRSGTNHAAVALLFLAALTFYLARPTLMQWQRWRKRPARETEAGAMLRWTLAFSSVATLSGLLLLVGWQRWLLLVLAAPAALLMLIWLTLALRRQQMSETAELVGIAGLSIGAPAAAYTASGQWQGTLFVTLWALSFAYFGGTVFYIKLKAREQPGQPLPTSRLNHLRTGRLTLLWQASALLLAVVAATQDLLPPLAAVALLPGVLKNLHGVLNWQHPEHLRMLRLGIIEIVHSALFASLAIAAYLL